MRAFFRKTVHISAMLRNVWLEEFVTTVPVLVDRGIFTVRQSLQYPKRRSRP